MARKSETARSGAGPAFNAHLQQLAYLREFQRSGSVTAAALALHVSQPALSQSLDELERRAGQALFEREGRRRRLTAAGREVLDFANEVLSQAEGLRHRLDALERGEEGRLRVGMIDAASLYVLPSVVRDFRRDHPRVELSLTVAASHALLESLRRFELDLVFAVGPLDADLRGRVVRRESLYIYRSAEESPHSPADVEWVLYPSGSRTRALIDAGLAARGIRPRVSLESGSPEVLRQMVALGFGWSVLPESVADGIAGGGARGEPLAKALRGSVSQRTIYGIQRKGAPELPLVADFLRRAVAS